MSKVRLEPVTLDNWQDVIKIDLEPEQWQNLDAPSVLYNLCESLLRSEYAWPHAVYDAVSGETVGYVVFGGSHAWKHEWHASIHFLIIDRHHQGKGYGRAAALEAIRLLREWEPACTIAITYRRHNDVAFRLYASLGWVREGEYEGDELAVLRSE